MKALKKETRYLKVISLPHCIHWFGTYDFIALFPQKEKLEVRFVLDKAIINPRIFISVPMSSRVYKNCIYLKSAGDINEELIAWLKASYILRKGE
jgi:hypothetical protein